MSSQVEKNIKFEDGSVLVSHASNACGSGMFTRFVLSIREKGMMLTNQADYVTSLTLLQNDPLLLNRGFDDTSNPIGMYGCPNIACLLVAIDDSLGFKSLIVEDVNGVTDIFPLSQIRITILPCLADKIIMARTNNG